MFFGNYRGNTQIEITIDGVNLERVKENKFLSVIMDDKLNWKAHIKHIPNYQEALQYYTKQNKF